MNTKLLTVSVLSLTLACGAPLVQAQASGEKMNKTAEAGAKLAKEDESFARKAAMGGMAEVQLGELAQQKAENPDVKHFGKMMVDDHSKANKDLMSVASSKGLQLPAEVDAKHKAKAEKLGKLSGPEFDKAYTAEMLKDHKKDVSEYESALKSVKDPDLKAYVERTLPVLKQHLEHVKKLEDAMGKGKDKAGEKAGSEKKGA